MESPLQGTARHSIDVRLISLRGGLWGKATGAIHNCHGGGTRNRSFGSGPHLQAMAKLPLAGPLAGHRCFVVSSFAGQVVWWMFVWWRLVLGMFVGYLLV